MVEILRGKVTDAGRVVIPVERRKAFGLSEGEEVLFSRDSRSIRITPLSSEVWSLEVPRDGFEVKPAEKTSFHWAGEGEAGRRIER
jgi:AbrB family looped-hinge helix DNA binding protein